MEVRVVNVGEMVRTHSDGIEDVRPGVGRMAAAVELHTSYYVNKPDQGTLWSISGGNYVRSTAVSRALTMTLICFHRHSCMIIHREPSTAGFGLLIG